MTENPTNQPTQSEDFGNADASLPESPNAPNAFRKKRQGHFASDGLASHREVPVQPQQHSDAPAAAPKRFEMGNQKPAPSKQTQPQQSVQRSEPVGSVRLPVDVVFERTRLVILALCLVPLFVFGSLPSWESMVYEWSHTDDYSHGWLVIPATLFFLYLRLETYPGTRYKLDWVGLFPILIYVVCRHFAAEQYIEPLDAGAIWFWILGVVWFFYGWRVFLWALPSLLFLLFMFQLPFFIDTFMRGKLQIVAAQFGATLLQMVGVPAIPITNTIRLSTQELGVEAACSGLRFLMSIFAIAYATVLLMRRPWWQNILILAIAAPLALFVNAVRIAITGILLEYHYEKVAVWATEVKSVGAVADEFAGWVTVFLALCVFALFVWYLGKVFRRVEI